MWKFNLPTSMEILTQFVIGINIRMRFPEIFPRKINLLQGQNFSAQYKDNITITLPVRQAVYFIPEKT